ncbi:MAG: FtsH protease activity modulator HflK [Glaciimonas sp.]|nr:FtsH protease activity modulator HflK [Glaciimonas sp.]
MLGSILKKFGVKFSLSDPQWGRNSQNDNKQNDGKKSNNSPPDLDQLWRDFNQRLNRFFGKKNNGGGNGGDGNDRGKSFSTRKSAGVGAGVIAVIVAFLWLVSGFFTVQEGQTGVVMTFGKYSHSTMAGFNWRWPYPIQSHEIVNVSGVRTIEVGYRSNAKNKQPKEALMLTEDENIIDIQFAVQYKLKSAADWIFKNRDQEETVRQVAETSIREIVGKSQMDFVLYEGREKVALDVSQLMQQILDHYKSGVQITNVTMQGVQPPEQVQAAFDDAVKAGQDRERQKNEGQAYANDVIPKARGAASRLLQEAEAYSARVTANAEGDASRFKQVLTEYQKAPAVTRERMYLDTMQQIFANTTKVMIDAKSGNNLLYLPLDKLIAQSAASIMTGSPGLSTGAAVVSSPTAPKDSGVPAVIDSRSRETRDRERR